MEVLRKQIPAAGLAKENPWLRFLATATIGEGRELLSAGQQHPNYFPTGIRRPDPARMAHTPYFNHFFSMEKVVGML